MRLSLATRRAIWWPTLLGWTCLLALVGGATALWWFEGESFLSATQRQPADVLVVESWIGLSGLHAAQAEFTRGGYRWLVSAGGLSNNHWETQRWNYADEGQEYFVRWGMPPEKIIVARARDTEGQRTFATAVAAWQALRAAGLRPKSINVFTIGPHARRSRLIFAKVFAPDTQVGVVPWLPAPYTEGPWWRSSDRAEDLIKETVGYLFEVLLNSGRTSNSPSAPAAPNETRTSATVPPTSSVTTGH